MLCCRAQGRHHARTIRLHDPPDETRFGAERQRHRVEGRVDRTHGRGLGDLPDLGGGGVLALGQPVDLVVEEQDREVDVAAHRVDQMVATDGQGIAVTGHDPDRKVRAGRRQTRRDRRGTPVDRVHAIGVEVVREARGAADAGDEGDVLALEAELGQEGLDRGEDDVVTTPRAPAHLLIGGELLLRLLRVVGTQGRHPEQAGAGEPSQVPTAGRVGQTHRRVDCGHDNSSTDLRMTSTNSVVAKGSPRTALWERMSTRYFARRSIASWPRFISGRITRS